MRLLAVKQIKDMKPIKKAYEINLDKINEGYLYSNQSCHADNLNKAKSKLLYEIRHEDWKLRHSDDDLTYLTIPVIRCPRLDLYEFEGQSVSKERIDGIKRERERIQSLNIIMQDENINYCYIMKRGAYYRPNSCGYTEYKSRAGVYSKLEAVRDGKSCNELTIVPIDIDAHNKMIQDVIDDLGTRLIPSGHAISIHEINKGV